MFTGIITDIGIAKKIEKTPNTIRLAVETKYDVASIAMGASISCNGCCLTVVKKENNIVEFDLSPETLQKTNYNNLKIGDLINLEQALKMGDELGGHIVTGHVDCLIEVVSIDVLEGNWRVNFKVPSAYKKYVVTKGSATLNGVSLTINNVENDIFGINIIPHTLEQTNLRLLKVGSKVNFEIDMLARYLEKLTHK
jgi:riboflavin synthase